MIRKIVAVWVATFCVMQAGVAGTSRAAPDRPDILWLTCEDMSPNLGCYGDPDAVTPNLDRLASRGVRSPFLQLQRLQEVTRFSHSDFPPRDCGRMWSSVSWFGGCCVPQYWQVWSSRRKLAPFEEGLFREGICT